MGAGGSKIEATAPASAANELVDYSGPGPWYKCTPDAEVPPRVSKDGFASAHVTPPVTLPELFRRAVEKRGDKEALLVERPVPALVDGKAPPALPRDEWTKWTFAEYYADVKSVAKGFLQLGFKQFDSVNIWGFNSPEWVIAAYAATFAAGKCAGIYPTDTGDSAAYKVVHSGGSIIVLEDRKKLEHLAAALSARGDAKVLKAFVAWGFEPAAEETIDIKGCGSVPVISWAKLLELGNQVGDEYLTAAIDTVKPGHCAALIYTSGTTGDPKAVMISHDNILYEANTVNGTVGKSCGLYAGGEERIVSFLPLSHVAGMMVDIVAQIAASALDEGWSATFFARPYDLKVGSLKDRLQAVKPTLFLGVPLVWEKIADKMRSIGANTTGLKKSLGDWAKGLGLENAHRCQMGGSGSAPFGYSLASMLIFSKLKAALGLECCKFGFTGAAPMREDTQAYYGSLGIQINEVYGMSECTGATTISTDQAHQWGSVGWALPGTEVKAFICDPVDFNKKTECPRAPDVGCTDEQYMGELCFRGRHIMMGYMAQPALGAAHVKELEKKTAETIDNEGWLHSGDKGMVTDKGLVKITGRYKELIIGEGGENISPVPIEDHVKKTCEGICEVMMVGDKRKYNVALVTLKAVGASGETPGTDVLDSGAKRVNPEVTTISGAMEDKVWIDAITNAIKSANANGKVCPNNAFKIQKFSILPTNFSEENNELTPTKKLKRKVVETRYHDLIEKMYKTDGTYIHF